jgi:hypothetical protein
MDQLRPYIAADALNFESPEELIDNISRIYIDPDKEEKAHRDSCSLLQLRCTYFPDLYCGFPLVGDTAGIPRST